MAWIELHQQLPSHPKTKRLARALGLAVPENIPQVVGHLCLFWLWCIDYAIDGNLDEMSSQDIADAAGWVGDPDQFLSALQQAGFVDEDVDGRCVHDWDEYGGKLLAYRAKERVRNREKQKRHRERIKGAQESGESREERQCDAGAEADALDGLDSGWLELVQCYERNIGLFPTGTSSDIISSYVSDLGAGVVCKAIEITNKAQPDHPWHYLNSVLKKWTDLGINTVGKADAYNLDLERRLQTAKKRTDRAQAEKTTAASFQRMEDYRG